MFGVVTVRVKKKIESERFFFSHAHNKNQFNFLNFSHAWGGNEHALILGAMGNTTYLVSGHLIFQMGLSSLTMQTRQLYTLLGGKKNSLGLIFFPKSCCLLGMHLFEREIRTQKGSISHFFCATNRA
jgi:hypothetical protein